MLPWPYLISDQSSPTATLLVVSATSSSRDRQPPQPLGRGALVVLCRDAQPLLQRQPGLRKGAARARAEGGEMEGLTGSEIAGFVVGGLLLGATIAAPKVDGFIASSQRRSLGMCKRCGDLRIVACSQCKGIGSVRKGGILNLGMLDDIYESLGAEAKTDNLIPCTKCRSKGRLLCPECSKIA